MIPAYQNWRVSKTDSLPFGREVNGFMVPKTDSGWENISAERRDFKSVQEIWQE